jgi:Right handed beta helix region
MKYRSTAVALFSASAVVFAVGVTPAQAVVHHTWDVEPGSGTISAAVAKASPGDVLQLEAGTYWDSVGIPMTLTIRGAGEWKTVIKPPKHPKALCDTPASGSTPASVEGLCPFGALDSMGNPIPSKPVVGVTISDLRLTGFSDSGVIGFNTKGLHVYNVRSDHNGGYGIARFVSTDSLFENNSVSYNGEAGLYMGDSPDADSMLVNNWADHNGYGLFMRDSTGLTATGNHVWGNCVGILALNSGGGAPGDLPAGVYRITGNTVWANDSACPSAGGPPTSGIGIALAGVHNTVVSGNWVTDNHPSGPSLISGGIVVLSTAAMGGANPTNNTVRGNYLDHNKAADIVWDGTGSGNKISDNNCDTSIPPHLCFCS